MSYKCDLCEKTFVNKRGLTNHIKNKVCEKYKCDKCEQIYSCNTTYKYHLLHKVCDKKLTPQINLVLKSLLPICINNVIAPQSLIKNTSPINMPTISNNNISTTRISKKMRNDSWIQWMGYDTISGLCLLCNLSRIHLLETWHCSHINSIYNNGDTNINNLRPICSGCNLSMGRDNMTEYCLTYPGALERLGLNSTDNSNNSNNTDNTDNSNNTDYIGFNINNKKFISVSLKKVIIQLIKNNSESIKLHIQNHSHMYDINIVETLERYLNISEDDIDYNLLENNIINLLINIKDAICNDPWASDLFSYLKIN